VGIQQSVRNSTSLFCRRQVELYGRILEHNGIEHRLVDVDSPDFLSVMADLDYFVYPWLHSNNEAQVALAVLPVLENYMGKGCFPNLATCWHYDDKIRQYYLLESGGFPIIPTRVFWDRGKALAWLSGASFPVVFKLAGGAGSENVLLLTSRGEAERVVRRMFDEGMSTGSAPRRLRVANYKALSRRFRKFAGALRRRLAGRAPPTHRPVHKNYVLFQEFLPGNAFDTRINIIGRRAFGFRRHNRPGDFRASGGGELDYDPAGVDERCLRIAFEVSRAMGFQCMSYDFLFDGDGEPRIGEISYTFVDFAVFACPGFWDEELGWHEGHYWPEYCQLADLLGRPDLLQPPVVWVPGEGLREGPPPSSGRS